MGLENIKSKESSTDILVKEWKIKRVKDVCPLQRGFDLPSSNLKKGIYPVVYSNGEGFLHNEYMVKGPGVVTGRSGTIGKIHYVEKNYWPHNTSLWVTNFNGNHPKYVYYLLKTIGLERFGTGSGVPTLNRNDVHDYVVSLPPTLTEQKAIATALSDVDALITSLEQTITKKKAIKQGAMQQLLTPPHKGGKRLPGFEGEWVEKILGEVCDITGAGIDKKIVEGEKPVRLFNYMDVMKRDYVYNHELNHQVTAPYYKTNSCNVIEGDIFLTPSSELRTDIGVSAIAMEEMKGVVYSYHVYRLRYTIEINKFYGLYLLKTKQFLDQAEKMCEGSGKRYVVSMGKFRNMTVYLPKDIKEQEAISDILYDMDTEITQLESKKEKYQAIKQGMMQELLTGKTRLI